MSDNENQQTSGSATDNEKFSDAKWRKLFNDRPAYKALFKKNKELTGQFESDPAWAEALDSYDIWLWQLRGHNFMPVGIGSLLALLGDSSCPPPTNPKECAKKSQLIWLLVGWHGCELKSKRFY
jgi:hypothetical protein